MWDGKERNASAVRKREKRESQKKREKTNEEEEREWRDGEVDRGPRATVWKRRGK